MSDKTTKSPQIRFEGFTDAWEQRIFSDVLKFSVSNNTLSRARLNYEDGEVKNIHYGDILVKFDYIVDVNSAEVPWITDGKPDTYKAQWLQNGDVIIADTAEDEATGKAIEVAGISDNYAVSGLHTIVARPIQEFAPKYLGYYLNSPAYHNKLLPLMQGTKVLSLSKATIAKTKVAFPNDLAEQTKIGTFIDRLGSLIPLHQRKLELFKETKKSLLKKMFPKDGVNVPEIRFTGFTDAWEQRSLTEVANYRNGKAHEQNIDENGKFIVVNSKFVSTDGRIKKCSNQLIEPLIMGEITFVLSDVPNGKALAKTFLVEENDRYSLNQRIAGITPHNHTDSYYLSILMNRNKYFLQFDSGVGQTNLSKVEVENFTAMYPSYEEQNKIGLFFKNIDRLINLQQQELNALKKLKKSLLQQMFV